MAVDDGMVRDQTIAGDGPNFGQRGDPRAITSESEEYIEAIRN